MDHALDQLKSFISRIKTMGGSKGLLMNYNDFQGVSASNGLDKWYGYNNDDMALIKMI